jgi:hypothetical protein
MDMRLRRADCKLCVQKGGGPLRSRPPARIVRGDQAVFSSAVSLRVFQSE